MSCSCADLSIFFFKQKTSYEMRISDWSSDVCSSDLAALSAVCRAVALEGQPAGIRANVVMLGLIDTPMGRAATQARPDRLTQPMPFGRQGTSEEEIGRASGRERVCKYVKI